MVLRFLHTAHCEGHPRRLFAAVPQSARAERRSAQPDGGSAARQPSDHSAEGPRAALAVQAAADGEQPRCRSRKGRASAGVLRARPPRGGGGGGAPRRIRRRGRRVHVHAREPLTALPPGIPQHPVRRLSQPHADATPPSHVKQRSFFEHFFFLFVRCCLCAYSGACSCMLMHMVCVCAYVEIN